MPRSTSTTTTAFRFEAVSTLEFSMIESIIKKSPVDARDLTELMISYREVLDLHGIEPVDDEKIYNLLLKLSDGPGSNYLQKWANVVDSYQERGIQLRAGPGKAEKGLQMLKERMEKVSITPGRTRTPPLPPSISSIPILFPSTATRPKSTTLEPKTRPFLVSPALNTAITSSEDEHYYQSSLPRPSRREENGPTTGFPPKLNSSPAPSLVRARPPRSEAQEDPLLLQQADTFRKLADFGRLFDRWTVKLELSRSQDEEVDEACRLRLLRKAMYRWKMQLKGRVKRVEKITKVCTVLVVKKDKELLFGAFVLWRQKLQAREGRIARREGLQGALKVATDSWNGKALRDRFEHWHHRRKFRQAVSVDHSNLLRNVMSRWSNRAGHLQELSVSAFVILKERDVATQYSILQLWSKKACLSQKEKQWAQRDDEDAKSEAWTVWSDRLAATRAADEFYNDILASATIRKWKKRLSDVRKLYKMAHAFQVMQNRRTASSLLKNWSVARIGNVVARSRSQKVLKNAFAGWLERWSKISIDGNAVAAAFLAHSDKKLLSTYFITWSTASKEIIELERNASILAEDAVKRTIWKRWTETRDKRFLEGEKAEVAANFFLQRQVWNRWYRVLTERRRLRWAAARDSKLLETNFKLWREKMMARKEEQRLLDGFKALSDLTMKQSIITRWTTRIVESREREVAVTKSREKSILLSCFSKWTDRCIAHGENISLVESFKEIKREELLRKLFHHWSYRTRHVISLEAKLESFLLVRDEDSMANLWDEWRDKFGESILKENEKELEILVKEKLVARIFERWRSRTLSIPAIQFNAETTRRRYFTRWKEQLPMQLLLKEATAYDLKITAGHAFLIWHMKSRSRTAIRAASRFRAIAVQALPSSRGSPLPPLSRHRSRPSITAIPSTPTPQLPVEPEDLEEENKSLINSLSYSPTGLIATKSTPPPISLRTSRLSPASLSTPTSTLSSRSTTKETILSTPATEERVTSVSTVRDGIRARLALAAAARR